MKCQRFLRPTLPVSAAGADFGFAFFGAAPPARLSALDMKSSSLSNPSTEI